MSCERKIFNSEQKQDMASFASDELRSQALQQLLAQSLAKFDQTDKNSNGFLDFKELSTGGGKNEQVLAKGLDTVQKQSNDEWLIENDGASKKDLNVLFNQARFTAEKMRDARDIRETVGRNFSFITPGDEIRRRDLRTAIDSGELNRCDKAILIDTYHNFYKIGQGLYSPATSVLRKPQLAENLNQVEYKNRAVFDVAKHIEF